MMRVEVSQFFTHLTISVDVSDNCVVHLLLKEYYLLISFASFRNKSHKPIFQVSAWIFRAFQASRPPHLSHFSEASYPFTSSQHELSGSIYAPTKTSAPRRPESLPLTSRVVARDSLASLPFNRDRATVSPDKLPRAESPEKKTNANTGVLLYSDVANPVVLDAYCNSSAVRKEPTIWNVGKLRRDERVLWSDFRTRRVISILAKFAGKRDDWPCFIASVGWLQF